MLELETIAGERFPQMGEILHPYLRKTEQQTC